MQYDINREAVKISALSSGKIDKHEYFTGEKTLPSNQRQILEEATFACSPLGKAFEKQTKMIEYQGEKQINAIGDNKNNYIINNQLIMNYCFHRREKYLRIITTKKLIKYINYLKRLVMVT